MYYTRAFGPEDVSVYKAMQLEALQMEPGNFGNSYALEQSFPDRQWLERLINPLGCCFGLYAGTELIGITGIIAEKDKPGYAYMTQSYIREPYRGKGLSVLLYEARLDWARAHGIRRLEIGHRFSNIISKAANQHFGFSYTHSVSRVWPDGATEDMCYYELYL